MSSGAGGNQAYTQPSSSMVCPPLPPPLTFGGAAALPPFPAAAGPGGQPGSWPPALPPPWPVDACAVMQLQQQAAAAEGGGGMADMAGGGSPMFLHPGDMDEDPPDSVPQGFQLGSPPRRRGSWHSPGPQPGGPPGLLASPPAALPQSRSCSSALQAADLYDRLSQDSCAGASPVAAHPPLLPDASQPDLAAAAMPPPAPQRRARSVPPRPAASGTPTRASAAKAGGSAAKGGKASKAGNPTGSGAGWGGGISPKGGRVGKSAAGGGRGSGGRAGGKPGRRSSSGGGKAGDAAGDAAAAANPQSPQMSAGLPPVGHSFSAQDVSMDCAPQQDREQPQQQQQQQQQYTETGSRRWSHTTLEQLRAAQHSFAVERGWEKFHTPRNLIMALTGEVGELAEVFQWRGEVAAGLPGFSAADRQHAGEELSDVLLYLVRLADVCGVDLAACAHQKIAKNGRKYPAASCYGSSAKYTAYASAADATGAEAGPELPAAAATGQRSVRRPAHAGGGGAVSKRRASAPAGHQQQMQVRVSRLEPAQDAACGAVPEVPDGFVTMPPGLTAQPMDCTPPGPTPQLGSWQLAPPQQQQQLPQHPSIAALGRQPTPPVTPAAVEGLSPARSPIPGLGAAGGALMPPRAGSGGSLIPGIDPGADWPLGASWGALPSLRTEAGGPAGGGAPGQPPAASGISRAQHDSMHAAGEHPPAMLSPGGRGSPGRQRGALLPSPVPRHGTWQGGREAPALEPRAGPVPRPADGPTSPASAAAAPMLPPASSPMAPGRGGSTALTAANIEWLRHADPVELLTMGLPK